MRFIKNTKDRLKLFAISALSVLAFATPAHADSAFAAADSFSLYSDGDEGTECLAPADWSALIGNYQTASYLPPCSGFLTPFDQTVTSFNLLLTKSEFLEHADLFERKGNDVERQKIVFQEHRFDFGIGADIIAGVLATVLVVISLFKIFEYMNSKRNQKEEDQRTIKSLAMMLTMAAFFVIASSSFVRANILITIATTVNSVNLYFHDVEDFMSVYEDGFLEETVGVEKAKNNKRLTNMLHQVILERVLFERHTINKYFGSDEGFRESGVVYRPTLDLSGQEYLEMAYECLGTFQMEIDMSSEITFTNGFNYKSEIPENHYIKSGGQSKDYYCSRHFFGRETTLAVIESNFPNVMKNIFQGYYKEDLAEDSSAYEDLKALFDVSLGEAEKVVKAAVVAGSNRNLMLDGLLMQSYAAVKKSNPHRTNINTTENFDTVASMFEKDLKRVLNFGEDFTTEERLNLSNLAIEAYKMALIGGYEHGEYEQTKEELSGFQPLESFLRDTVLKLVEYEAALASTPDSYMMRVKAADAFNQRDLSNDNEDYTTGNMVAGFKLEGFAFNFDSVDVHENIGKPFQMKAVGNPEDATDIYKDMVDRKLAFETLFNAVDIAGYRWAMSNAQEVDKSMIIEMLNDINLSSSSPFDFKNKQIERQAGVKQVVNAEMDLYEIRATEWDLSSRQTYFPYELVGVDVNDVDAVKLFDETHQLKKYDASMLLTGAYSATGPGVVADRTFAEILGMDDFIADIVSVSGCRIRDAGGACQMSAVQQAKSNTSSNYQTMGITGMGIAAVEIAGSLCKMKGAAKVGKKSFGMGAAKNKAMEMMEGGCDIVDALKSLITTPLGFMFLVSLILAILNGIVVHIGLVVGFIMIIYPFKSLPALIPTLLLALVNNTFFSICRLEINFNETVKIAKEIAFQLLNYPLMMFILYFTLMSPFIAGALYDMTYQAIDPSKMNPFTVLFTDILTQVVNLVYVWSVFSIVLTKNESAAREAFGVSNHLVADTGQMSYARAAVIMNVADKAQNSLTGTKDRVFGRDNESVVDKVKKTASKRKARKESQKDEK